MLPPDDEVSLAEGAELIASLSDALRRMQAAIAEAVDLAGQVQRAGVIEVIEGLPLELFLALEHRLTSAGAHMVMEAARVLQRMPVTKTLFHEGKLSWCQLQGIVARLRRVKVEDPRTVDERVEASLDVVDKFSPDELVWAELHYRLERIRTAYSARETAGVTRPPPTSRVASQGYGCDLRDC